MIGWLLAIAAFVLLPFVINLGSSELYSWLPALTRRIVEGAAGRVRDPELRERLEEEWLANLEDIPGHVSALLHGMSLLLSARRIERTWKTDAEPAPLGDADLISLSRDVGLAFQKFGRTLRDARAAARVSLDELMRRTRIPVHYLSAIENSQFARVPQGVYVKSYLTEIAKVLGIDTRSLLNEYKNLVRNRGVYFSHPPDGQPTKKRSTSVRCLAGHHKWQPHFVHPDGGLFHLRYYDCERCSAVTELVIDFCSGKRVARKREAGIPAELVYSCESCYWPEP